MSNDKATKVVLFESEVEKAAARVAEKAAGATVDGASSLLQELFGGLFYDGIRQWRNRNLINSLIKTKEHLEKNGISIEKARALPMGELYTIFEAASKQDNPILSDMWASLLSNAMNPNNEEEIDISFLRILENLSGLEALILQFYRDYKVKYDLYKEKIKGSGFPIYMPKEGDDDQYNEFRKFKSEIEDFSSLKSREIEQKYNKEKISSALSNLIRSNLIINRIEAVEYEDLITIEKDKYDSAYNVNDRNLKSILNEIIRELLSKSEENGVLELTKEEWSFSKKMPSYNLSGLGSRFLNCCT